LQNQISPILSGQQYYLIPRAAVSIFDQRNRQKAVPQLTEQPFL
jgi:hypothetical protein